MFTVKICRHIFTQVRTSLPLVTGKAAPEHRCHSVSSLFPPGQKKKKKKSTEKEIRPTNYQMLAIKKGLKTGNSDYLFVHFNVQPVRHFIVL